MIILDSGPLGLISNPTRTGDARGARDWARVRIEAGDRLLIPEIADYEIRRELIRAGKDKGIERLDALCVGFEYSPLTTTVMRDAAGLWAEARNAGRPTADDAGLDGDVILAAQTRALATEHDLVPVVATTNTRHLRHYVDARLWTDL